MNQQLEYEIAQVVPQAISTGLFVSLATVQEPPTTQGPTGNPSGPYTDVPGLVNIPCMDAPPSMARLQATEVKAVAEIMAMGIRHVLLDQCFVGAPDWADNGWRVVVDGVVYDLFGAENDSQSTQTRLDLKLVQL